MPELTWIGKDKVVTHHNDVPYRTLNRVYSFDADGKSEEDNGSGNMIIHGDNLEALKSLLPKYEGKVDCIYIDPPYNTGNEGWIYNDNVNDPKIKKWLGEVVGKEGEDLSRHDKWLCMMYPRLRLLQKSKPITRRKPRLPHLPTKMVIKPRRKDGKGNARKVAWQRHEEERTSLESLGMKTAMRLTPQRERQNQSGISGMQPIK